MIFFDSAQLLIQQKPRNALFCILQTSICIKTHYSWLWLVWKGPSLYLVTHFDSSYTVIDLSKGAEKCHEVWVICMVMSKKGQAKALLKIFSIPHCRRYMIFTQISITFCCFVSQDLSQSGFESLSWQVIHEVLFNYLLKLCFERF